MRTRLGILIAAALLILLIAVAWHFRPRKQAAQPQPSTGPTSAGEMSGALAPKADFPSQSDPTNVYAHNLMLRKGPDFRIYVRWLRGQMVRTSRNVNPSFDDPESFFMDIKTGVIRANMGDINNFLNATAIPGAPLKNIKLTGDGNHIKLQGDFKKVISLPIELTGTISAAAGNQIQVHVTKISALKIPIKGVMGGLHLSVADLFHPQGNSGIQVSGDDILLDTQKLVPPPHIRGQLTNVRVVNPDLEEVYGNGEDTLTRVEQWRNFLRLHDGTLDFGKLTMHHVDLIMIDLSNDAWFDLDLNNYQDQLVNGYTRMTPQAGLQIFMPDLDDLRKKGKAGQTISLEWLKNRNLPPPPDVVTNKE
jgi:hypothetical protein